jgi:hypothetical protein
MFILDFFDREKECPDHLKVLKEEYFKELSNLEIGCKNCELKKLRDKYLEILISFKNK